MITMAFRTDENAKYTADKIGIQNIMDLLTKAGRSEVEDRIITLHKKRPVIAEQIAAARENGGVEENEELHMSMEEMNRVDTEIGRLQTIIEKSTLLTIPAAGDYDVVAPGLTVELENYHIDKIVTYTILGEYESNPSHGSISFKSPLGRELIGLAVGEVAELLRGDDVIEYEVLKIYVRNVT
jgi:transcription elongation factor GreA